MRLKRLFIDKEDGMDGECTFHVNVGNKILNHDIADDDKRKPDNQTSAG